MGYVIDATKTVATTISWPSQSQLPWLRSSQNTFSSGPTAAFPFLISRTQYLFADASVVALLSLLSLPGSLIS